jgi:hypothetical protein
MSTSQVVVRISLINDSCCSLQKFILMFCRIKILQQIRKSLNENLFIFATASNTIRSFPGLFGLRIGKCGKYQGFVLSRIVACSSIFQHSPFQRILGYWYSIVLLIHSSLFCFRYTSVNVKPSIWCLVTRGNRFCMVT